MHMHTLLQRFPFIFVCTGMVQIEQLYDSSRARHCFEARRSSGLHVFCSDSEMSCMPKAHRRKSFKDPLWLAVCQLGGRQMFQTGRCPQEKNGNQPISTPPTPQPRRLARVWKPLGTFGMLSLVNHLSTNIRTFWVVASGDSALQSIRSQTQVLHLEGNVLPGQLGAHQKRSVSTL